MASKVLDRPTSKDTNTDSNGGRRSKDSGVAATNEAPANGYLLAAKAITPMAHQKESLKHDKANPLVFDMSDAGTGKTGVRILAFADRRRKGGGCMLVAAPRSLLTAAWANDIRKFAPHLVVSVATAKNREEAFKVKADVYITNHDAATWLGKQKKDFFNKFDELVIDESTAYKHHTSQRSRALFKISAYFKQKKLMTATPTSNGILDIWHQMMLLDGGKRLGKSYFAFRNTVCTPMQVGRSAQAVRWQDKPGAEEAVFSLIEDVVIRHEFDKCVDIPETHTYTVEYELPKKQRDTYETMRDAQLLILHGPPAQQVANKMLKTAPKVTAVNAAAVATKLLQISSGAVYDNAGGHQAIDTGRYEMILDLVEARKHPLVFFYWKHQKAALCDEAARRKLKYAVIDGDASDKDRNEIVQAYQNGAYDVIFAHPQSAAHGLTLTAGTSTIWTCPTYNLEWFSQGNKRQARIGQKHKTEVVVVVAKDTIEEDVYNNILLPKNGRMTNLLDLFAS